MENKQQQLSCEPYYHLPDQIYPLRISVPHRLKLLSNQLDIGKLYLYSMKKETIDTTLKSQHGQEIYIQIYNC
jgi:hypothetical protein